MESPHSKNRTSEEKDVMKLPKKPPKLNLS